MQLDVVMRHPSMRRPGWWAQVLALVSAGIADQHDDQLLRVRRRRS